MFENVGANGLTKIADQVSASHLVFADKVSDKVPATLNKQGGDFVRAFSLLGVGFLLLGAGALKLYSDRNPPNKPSPEPPMSLSRRQQTTPTVSAVAEDETEKTGSPSSDGGKSVAGTERNVLDHEKTVLTQKADGVEILHEFKIRRAGT